ncbi:MAG TPA: hypothetical protein VMW06_04970 [Desulfobacterales bacterium]|nr:hypothetical protein [Desulfobacterales bacterium]
MKRKVGLWIDKKKAVIVRIEGENVTIQEIESGVEKHTRLKGGSRSATPYGPQEVSSEGRHDRRHQHALSEYYEELIGVIGDADKIYIMGPGETKGELKKAIEKIKHLANRITAVEAADKMTQRQIVAKVKDVFSG